MTGLPREVIKWLQSLDLSLSIRNVRRLVHGAHSYYILNVHVHVLLSRDFSNGYLLAEILRCYYPQELPTHSFSNGTSIQTRLGNWQQIERVLFTSTVQVSGYNSPYAVHSKAEIERSKRIHGWDNSL